jgi:hypothetical protein
LYCKTEQWNIDIGSTLQYFVYCYVYILVLHIKRFITAEFENVFVEFITTSECDCGAYYSGAKLVISILMQKPRNQAGVTALAYLSYFP